MTAAQPDQLQLNCATLQVGGPQCWVNISDSECVLLKALAQRADSRLDNACLLARVGKTDDDAAKRALEVQIVRLRKKLAHAGAPAPTIKAIRGFGYQLCISLAVSQSVSQSMPQSIAFSS